MDTRELADICGPDNVITDSAMLDAFTLDSRDGRFRPVCIVRPDTADEVAALVRRAGQTATPLVPVSSGPPHGRGDTAPSREGTVVVDLARMNRIVRIDTVNNLALIEPGVTYGQLKGALAEKGLCPFMPPAPRAGKSVLAAVLEREPITMVSHHWDSTDPLLCAEVVFGTGDRFRTGEASGPETIEEQWELGRVQMNPFGHSHVDFQRLVSGAQGTMGIATWITVKCGTLAALSRALFTPSDTLEPLVVLAYQLTHYRLGGRLFIMNGLNLACLAGRDRDDIESLRQELPPWVLFATFEGYGPLPDEKVTYEEGDFWEVAAALGLAPISSLAGIPAAAVRDIVAAPSAEPFWKTRLHSGYEDVFFLTTLDKTPDFLRLVTGPRVGVYIQPIVHGTACHCEFTLYHEPAAADAVRKQAARNAAAIADAGGFFSRPYPAWRDIAYGRAAGTAAMQRKLRDIFDPHGIMNPGKLCFQR